jgi:hypothetical protein
MGQPTLPGFKNMKNEEVAVVDLLGASLKLFLEGLINQIFFGGCKQNQKAILPLISPQIYPFLISTRS